MPKASEKKKGKYKDFFDRILESFFESVEKNAEDVLGKVSDFAFLRTAVKKYMIFMMFSTVAIIMILYGLGLLINTYFPAIGLWIIFLSLGIITFIIGGIYLKLK